MSSRSVPAVEAIEVVKTFDGGIIRALDGVSMCVQQGEFVAISGPSGCGKSTLLHLIAGLDHPTSGSIVVDGLDLKRMRDIDNFRRREVGLVFQLHNLLPHLTAVQNIEIAMFANGESHRQQRERASELLSAVGLQDKARFEPTRLSGGERQRLAIARSLANSPRILLADEPTGNLDSASVDMVLEVFGRLRASLHAIMLVTHDSRVASAADRIVQMKDGRIVHS
jgi:putative ABC transport system ATP-binding protein